MEIERLTRKEAFEAMNSWRKNMFTIPDLGVEYTRVRNDLDELFKKAKEDAGGDVKSYKMDLCFGAAIYAYFKDQPWFNVRLAADDGFWRHLALKVIPDLIGARWGNDNMDHFFTIPSRIWPKALWWYLHLSLNNGDIDATKAMLLSRNFSTDTIENLVERTGRFGTNVAVYRLIMEKYAPLKNVVGNDFRKVMKLNTAKAMVLEPAMCDGKEYGYVESIFKELALS
jgi:hypothetical protein